MNVVTINCSQNKKSKSMSITNQLIDKLRQEISIDNLVQYRQEVYPINNCIGCTNCFEKGFCTLDQTDNMFEIKQSLLSTDLIIVGIPIYLNFINSYSKNLLDRLAYWTHLFQLASKQIVFVICASQSGIERSQAYLYEIAAHLGCVNISFINYNASIDDYNYINNQIEAIVKDIKYFKKKGNFSTKLHEQIFTYNKKKYLLMEQSESTSVELDYWKERNLLYYDTFQEYLEMCFKIKV